MNNIFKYTFIMVLLPSVHAGELAFTQIQKDFIHKSDDTKICLSYEQFPVDGLKDGKFVGIMSDIYKNISKQTGLKFSTVASTSMHELQNKLAAKECKILSILNTEDTLFTTVVPTEPFLQTHFTLVSALDKSFVLNLSSLEGKVLVTQRKNYKDYLLKIYPFLQIKVVASRYEMVQKVLNSEVYAFITLDEQADYVIDQYGYGRLKINGFLAKDNQVAMSIGVQKDEEVLYGVIQKALANISDDEIFNIVNSWRINRYKGMTDDSFDMKILGVTTFILFIMFYYQRKLKNFNKELEYSVSEKTKELQTMNDHLEETVAQKVNELIKKDEILTIQSKQAVMGEMISMIAHQWRQPLNTVTLSISNLQIQQMMGQKIEEKLLTKTLEDISKTVIYLSETIDDFKTYFHPDKKFETVLIGELLDKAINFVLPRTQVQNINISVKKSQDIEFHVYPNELIQVLLNILNNAIDAYEIIEKKDKKIELFAVKEGEELLLYIVDEAGGIDEENIKQLFEPYFSTKGKNGTGLGLYMSQMIIQKQFGGKIYVSSERDETTFIIKIPIKQNV